MSENTHAAEETADIKTHTAFTKTTTKLDTLSYKLFRVRILMVSTKSLIAFVVYFGDDFSRLLLQY